LSTSFDLFFRLPGTHFRIAIRLLLAAGLVAPLAVRAQNSRADTDSRIAIGNSLSDSLPDSPGALIANAASSSGLRDLFQGDMEPAQTSVAKSAGTATASAAKPKRRPGHLAMTVQANEVALPMPAHDKFIGGLRDSYTLFAMAGWVSSAGWSQLTNGSPNYGTDAGAFGERLGAAALRSATQGIMTKSIFAPLYHQDPRYFTMGRGNSFFKRAFYAGTRVLVTRTDSGRETLNISLLSGNAVGALTTPAYYPSHNTSASQVAKTFGTSLGGSAVGFLVDEFFIDALVELHLRKQQP
jgi:hypothetical protein